MQGLGANMPVSLRQRFERFFNASSDCQFYVKLDEQGRFKYVHVNPAALAVTGRARECDALGLTPVEVLGDDYGRTVQTNIEKAYYQAAPYHFTGALGRSGGGPSYDAYYIPLVEDDGRVVGVLGTARDITQVTSLNEQLLHAQRLEALGELSGSVAHDFNNVLSILQGAVHFLKRDDLSEIKRSVVLGEAEKAIETGMALTKRLTAFARKERIQALPHDIVTLVLTCQPMMRRVLGKRIKLDCQLPPDLWRACCDKNEFEIATINLAANARDAIDNEGEVLITASNKTRLLMIWPRILMSTLKSLLGTAAAECLLRWQGRRSSRSSLPSHWDKGPAWA